MCWPANARRVILTTTTRRASAYIHFSNIRNGFQLSEDGILKSYHCSEADINNMQHASCHGHAQHP